MGPLKKYGYNFSNTEERYKSNNFKVELEADSKYVNKLLSVKSLCIYQCRFRKKLSAPFYKLKLLEIDCILALNLRKLLNNTIKKYKNIFQTFIFSWRIIFIKNMTMDLG